MRNQENSVSGRDCLRAQMSHRTFGFARWLKRAVCAAVVMSVLLSSYGSAAAAEQGTSEIPWWQQEKIRFFWGQWQHHEKAGVSMQQVMDNLSRAGATVFVSMKMRSDKEFPGFNLDDARMAKERGIHYFGAVYGSYLRERGANMGAPLAVTATGEHYFGYGRCAKIPLPCPVYEPLYEQHLLEPMLKAAATGVVDGFHLDWEPYSRPEAGQCYCDHCFDAFMAGQGKKASAKEIEPKARHQWLQEHKLASLYEPNHRQRRKAMFSAIRDKVHQVKPDFIFAGYHMHDWTITDALHSPQAPHFAVDMRNYFEDHTRPWWQSYYAEEKKRGYIHIAGAYNITFFGYQPDSDVTADQWMYDTAINTDGTWFWFEEELSPQMWQSFWTADRRIRATEQKVGDFLLRGRQDLHFALPVEWSGDPVFADKIIVRTYHLGNQHLVHINNVDTDRPTQVRVRFGHLPFGSQWVIEDPITL